MYCCRCGKEVNGDGMKCYTCGEDTVNRNAIKNNEYNKIEYNVTESNHSRNTGDGNKVEYGSKVPDYLASNITFMILNSCGVGIITGILGIVYSSSARANMLCGNIEEAKKASKIAKNMRNAGIGLFILTIFVWIATIVASMLTYNII